MSELQTLRICGEVFVVSCQREPQHEGEHRSDAVTQRALAKITEAFLRLDERQEKLEPILEAALRDARANRLSRDSDTYRALVEAGMVEDS